jgi:DNA-binding MarR family transcriptional regulator
MARKTPQPGSPLTLDKVLHGPLRLGIVAALAIAEHRTFTELRDSLGATDGNLNASLQKLERVGYVMPTRRVENRGARTELRLTRAGHKALADYLEQLERILAPVRMRIEG